MLEKNTYIHILYNSHCTVCRPLPLTPDDQLGRGSDVVHGRLCGAGIAPSMPQLHVFNQQLAIGAPVLQETIEEVKGQGKHGTNSKLTVTKMTGSRHILEQN